MKDDETQPEIDEDISQEGKEPSQLGQQRAKGWKIIKIKPKEQAEAERLFFRFFPEASHWEEPSILIPFDPITYIPYLRQAALAILSTGIIGEKGLKGHTGHKEFFPVEQRELISALVEANFRFREVTFLPNDIIKHFETRFDIAAAVARQGGVKDKVISKVRREWREKISLTISQGKFPSNWRELIKADYFSLVKYRPRTEAQAYVNIFLHFAPQASDNRIAIWVNETLKSFGQPSVSSSNLREYIKKERQRRPYLSRITPDNPS
jgi:hypothetical protein